VAPRATVAEATGLVEELVPDEDGSAESELRAALARRRVGFAPPPSIAVRYRT